MTSIDFINISVSSPLDYKHMNESVHERPRKRESQTSESFVLVGVGVLESLLVSGCDVSVPRSCHVRVSSIGPLHSR